MNEPNLVKLDSEDKGSQSLTVDPDADESNGDSIIARLEVLAETDDETSPNRRNSK